MDKNVICEVKNRSSSILVYNIPDDGIRREFMPGETKRISFGELEKLTFQSGGQSLINNYLLKDTYGTRRRRLPVCFRCRLNQPYLCTCWLRPQ